MQKDRMKAAAYRKAALEGDLMAMNNLGTCYHRGEGVQEDHAMAFQWYMQAAERGDVYACFNVAECYWHGDGVEQSYEQAAAWYAKAAEQGDTQSQVNLANQYFLGQGVKKDAAKANHWWREAAFKGHVQSQKNLGTNYWDGGSQPNAGHEMDTQVGMAGLQACRGLPEAETAGEGVATSNAHTTAMEPPPLPQKETFSCTFSLFVLPSRPWERTNWRNLQTWRRSATCSNILTL